MANGWYDIATGTRFTPYVGGGIGAATVSTENYGSVSQTLSKSASATAFAYQVGLGTSFALNHSLALTAGYRFFGTSTVKLSGGESEPQMHLFRVGLRYSF